jgi:hypothetical protein
LCPLFVYFVSPEALRGCQNLGFFVLDYKVDYSGSAEFNQMEEVASFDDHLDAPRASELLSDQ